MDMRINSDSKNGSKSVKDIRVHIDLKMESEPQGWRLSLHSQSSLISLNGNLPICQKFGIGQVQVGVKKLNLG